MRATIAVLVCVLALTVVALAQPDKFFDRLTVTFNQPVKVNANQTLRPGTYVFQQIRLKGQPNVFDIRDQSGNHVAMTPIATDAVYSNSAATNVPGQTQVVLKEVGSTRYLDRIWFAGQNHGYNFSLAEDAASNGNSTTGSQTAKNGNSATSKSASSLRNNTAGTESIAVLPVREIVVLAVPVPTDASSKGASSNDNASSQSAPNSNTTSPSSSSSQSNPNSSSTNNNGGMALSNSSDASSSAMSSGSSGASAGANNQSSIQEASTTSATSSPSSSSSGQDTSSVSTTPEATQPTASPSSSSSGPASTTASTGDEQKPMQIEGCVTGPYGGSYMLMSTKDGKKYALAGDYDNIRESLGRTVTIWAFPSSAQDSQTSTMQGSATSSSSMPNSQENSMPTSASSSTNSSQSPADAGSVPIAVTVRSIQPVSETCDTVIP